MKHVHLLAGIALAFFLVACGGGGGTSNSGNGTGGTSSVPVGTHVEGFVSNPTTYDDGTLSKGQKYEIQDLLNIEVQDQIQFELVYYDATGRHVINTGNWNSSDTTSRYGTLTFNSGAFDANGGLTTTPQTITTFYGGQVFSASYSVLPRQVRWRGVVLADDSKTPLSGVEVDFYGPQNPDLPTSAVVFRGSVVSAEDGTFRASVPDSVSSFTLVNKTLPSEYQRYFRYKSGYYQTGDAACYAPITPQANGEHFLIDYTISDPTANGTILLLSSKESTPTVTACGG